MQDRFNQFFAKYNGVGNVGDTPENKGECVGLVEKFTDFLGLPHTWGNAKDLLTDADTKSFTIIQNSPDNIPMVGDIVVFSGDFNGEYGHTGIATGIGDINTFELFEQNDPLGSVSHNQTYNYQYVLGWMRPIIPTPSTTSPDPLQECLKQHGALVLLSNQKDITIDQLSKGNDDKQHQIDSLTQDKLGLEKEVASLEADNLSLKKNVSEVQKQNSDLLGKMQEMAKADATAIDLGVVAQQKYNDLIKQRQVEQQQQVDTFDQIWKMIVNVFWKKKTV